jgi:hypothetical protein
VGAGEPVVVEPDPPAEPPQEPEPEPKPPASQLPISYIGAARITQGTVGESRPAWTDGAIHVTDDGIWMAGHAQHMSFGKYALPTEWANTYDLAQMPYVENTVPFALIDTGTSPRMTINGLYEMQDGRLLINTSVYYDADGGNPKDMFVFVNGEQIGPYKVQSGAMANGWMAKTPDQYVDEIGPYYMGFSSNIPINLRLSHGPSLFGWSGDTDPSTFVETTEFNRTRQAIPTKKLMAFPLSAPMGEHSTTNGLPASPVWNVLSNAAIGFIHGEDYIALGYTQGLRSGISYKIAKDADGNVILNDDGTPRESEGWLTNAPDDFDRYYWKFKMSDILNAESPELPRPYEYGVLDIPHNINGGSYVDGYLYLFSKTGQVVYKYEVLS